MCSNLYNFYYPSPIGLINIVFNKYGLIRIDFVDDEKNINNEIYIKSYTSIKIKQIYKNIYDQFNEYFTGKRKDFDLPIILDGSNFQLKVWNELKKIPYGETRSYGQIAIAIGKPNAARAVGNANNRNPLPLIIPCHRVIGSNGELTGYAGQLWRKKWLLDHEQKYRKGELIIGKRITEEGGN